MKRSCGDCRFWKKSTHVYGSNSLGYCRWKATNVPTWLKKEIGIQFDEPTLYYEGADCKAFEARAKPKRKK